MAVAIYLAIKNEPADLNLKWVKYVFGSVLFVLPFILNPVFPDDFEDVSTRVDEPFDTASVVSPKLKQLSEGKIFIAYFSVNCPFCLNAARKIAIAQKQHKNFPAVYVCMLGNQEQTDYFFDRANAKFDCDVMNSKDYSTLTHFAFPMFSWVEKGRVIRKWDGRTFNYGAMTEFCNWKKPE